MNSWPLASFIYLQMKNFYIHIFMRETCRKLRPQDWSMYCLRFVGWAQIKWLCFCNLLITSFKNVHHLKHGKAGYHSLWSVFWFTQALPWDILVAIFLIRSCFSLDYLLCGSYVWLFRLLPFVLAFDHWTH